MKDSKTILEEFCKIIGSRCTFSLTGGAYYEGYIIEIRDDHLIFGEGGPMADDKYLLISMENVDLHSLAYWDSDFNCYMDASWDNEQDK